VSLIVIGALIAWVALGDSGSENGGLPPSPSSGQISADSPSPEEKYIAFVRSQAPSLSRIDDAGLIEIGDESVCAVISASNGSQAVIDEIIESFTLVTNDPVEITVILNGAVRELCPEHERLLDEWAGIAWVSPDHRPPEQD
jgi:hypothetical protein